MSAAAGGGVDVLRNALDSLESREPFYPSMDDALAAVAAVAELIEAAKAFRDSTTLQQEREAKERLSAALLPFTTGEQG